MVNQRQAKREATATLSRIANENAARIRAVRGSANSPADINRLADAFAELAAELERRVTGQRKATTRAIDPAQLSLIEPAVTV